MIATRTNVSWCSHITAWWLKSCEHSVRRSSNCTKIATRTSSSSTGDSRFPIESLRNSRIRSMNDVDGKRAPEVFVSIRVLADRTISEPYDCINRLVLSGYSQARSERLYFIVELVFGRVIIEELGLRNFPETYILDSADGKEIEL